MFVQIIQGNVSDPGALKGAIDTWVRDVSPGAIGWLGSTGGVTADGRSIALVRFESAASAQANSDRPEQSEWWTSQMAPLFSGEPTFTESEDVTVDTPGDPEQAGFVQVMQGRTSNPERARELMNDDSIDWAALRPDILGMVSVSDDSGGYTTAIYFTSEAAAREGEQKEQPAEVQAMMEEMNSLSDGPPTFFDLTDPWMQSPS